LRDAKTGEVIYGGYTGKDTGRGMVGDVDPAHRGLETWAVGLWTAQGEKISDSSPGTNMNIKWSADMTTQIVDGAQDVTPSIKDLKNGILLTATDTRTNNGTKGNPSLVADIFGDWREELLVRKADSSAIRIYLSTDVTDRKLYTLMHDVQDRTGIAWQNTTYNQPAYPSFYFASDTNWKHVSVPEFWSPGVMSVLGNLLEKYEESGDLSRPLLSQLKNTYKQAVHHLEKGSSKQAVKAMEKFVSNINKNTKKGTISPEASKNLSYHAQLLLGMWKGEAN
jgi:rhamnogalacturonan endolyase